MRKVDRARIDRFKKVCTPMLERLGILQTYDVRLFLEDVIEPGAQGWRSTPTAAMEIISNYPYRQIHIHVCRKELDATTDEELERMVLHECLHPIIFGWVHKALDARDIAKDDAMTFAEEDAVSLLTQWLQYERSKLY